MLDCAVHGCTIPFMSFPFFFPPKTLGIYLKSRKLNQFFVFRYPKATPHTIPALRLKHRSGSCGTASALPKCSIMSGCGTRIVFRGQKKPLALCDRCPCFGSLFPPLAALTFAASSIICAFSLASAAPRSPYRHLELCGIALNISGSGGISWPEPPKRPDTRPVPEAAARLGRRPAP